MGHIEATRVLTASPEALWARVATPASWGEWFTIHDEWVEEPPEYLGAGAHLSAKIHMLGMVNKIEWTVEAADAPHRLVVSGTGMAGVRARFTFTIERAEIHSRITVSGDFEGEVAEGALAHDVETDGRRQLDRSLEALDALAAATA